MGQEWGDQPGLGSITWRRRAAIAQAPAAPASSVSYVMGNCTDGHPKEKVLNAACLVKLSFKV
jgi:hypothetical protein